LINTYNSEYVTEITNRVVAAMVGLDKEEKEGPSSGPTNRAKPRTPDELIGNWKGEIKTYAGSVPIMMHFAQDGNINASVGDQEKPAKTGWAQFHLLASTASWVMGTFDGTIPTDDTKRYPHNVLLSIGKQGEKLIGEAAAVVPWGHPRMYAGLSHYVELVKLNG
jgi:SNF2 family DNA or RNA helicase